MDADRWTHLVQQFRDDNFKLYQLNHHSVFTVALTTGLCALKTPYPCRCCSNTARAAPSSGQPLCDLPCIVGLRICSVRFDFTQLCKDGNSVMTIYQAFCLGFFIKWTVACRADVFDVWIAQWLIPISRQVLMYRVLVAQACNAYRVHVLVHVHFKTRKRPTFLCHAESFWNQWAWGILVGIRD